MRSASRRTLLRAALIAATVHALPKPTSVDATRWMLPAPEIPSTAVGKHLAWALDQVNGGASSLTEREVRQHFSSSFLAGLPASDLRGLFRTYLAANGPMSVARFEGAVTERRIRAILTTPNADWRVTIDVDAAESDRISHLFFEPVWLPAPLSRPVTSWPTLERRLSAIAPRVSFLAAELVDGKLLPLSRVTQERTISVASAFKLYVLGELAHQIETGLASWDEVFAIRDDLRSLPNGLMFLEPAGAPYPLRHFAEQMISNSDNTATDHLIGRLARENVESALTVFDHARPERNIPLLMTREWFAIKLRLSRGEIEAYLEQDIEAKRAFLSNRVAAEAITLNQFEPWPGGFFIDRIEWFASAADLCRVMVKLHGMAGRAGLAPIHDTLSISPGIAFDARTWAYVGYKGGYETGVKSEAWLLQRRDGRWFTLAAIINDVQKEIDGYGLMQLIMPAIQMLGNHD